MNLKKTENKLLILTMIGVIASGAMGVYFGNAWFMFWFLFSILLGNIIAENPHDSSEFAEWILWNTYYKPVRDSNGKFFKGAELKYHYPKDENTSADVRTHNYKYSIEELYDIFLEEKKNKKQI